MRLPRFRIRTLMVVAAAVAVGIATWRGSAAMMQRRARYLAMAEMHEATVNCFDHGLWFPRDDPTDIRYQHYKKPFDHYSALVSKYRHAARYPWLPVEPDPPDPW